MFVNRYLSKRGKNLCMESRWLADSSPVLDLDGSQDDIFRRTKAVGRVYRRYKILSQKSTDWNKVRSIWVWDTTSEASMHGRIMRQVACELRRISDCRFSGEKRQPEIVWVRRLDWCRILVKSYFINNCVYDLDSENLDDTIAEIEDSYVYMIQMFVIVSDYC